MDYVENDLLTNEFAPKRRDELQIHNKKLKDLSNWLKNAFCDNNGSYGVLYLAGPTGSGKSTSVEVLCREQGIELIDYSPELLHDDCLEFEKPDTSQLIRFLIRRHGSLNGGSRKKLLFICELPDQAYNDPELFREELCDTLKHIRHPVIFCLTNNVSCWNLNPDKLFTADYMMKNYIDSISFNPVADTFMKKALSRASQLLRTPLSEAKLHSIGEHANGDLRIAMNMLQMNSVGPDANRKTGNRIVFASKANREDAMHMIGRILYAKRVNPNVPKINRFTQKRRKSAPVPEPTERTDLEYDPTEIITMSSMSTEKLNEFLFENEHVFCSDISKYRHVVDTISYCDALTSDWSAMRSFPDEYSAQITVRSVMWHNFKGSRPGTMYPIARPAIKNLERLITMTKNEMKRLPMIGEKHFSSLTATYKSIIQNIIDPQRIEFFLSRPMDVSWKKGKDKIEDELEKLCRLSYRGRKNPRKPETNKRFVQKKKVDEEVEEEKFTIEESSDDSFDDM
uniref:AAA domain-containing protein n=1 Tax=Caenorhabditis tropicalis TaxID=1561998 RepID=A0A1I7UC49_9PELO